MGSKARRLAGWPDHPTWMLALLCATLACGGDEVTVIPPGQQCPNGGVEITTSSGAKQVVCGSGTVSSTTLPPGDAHCPNGGTRIDVAQSDGSTASQYVCNGSSGAQSASLTPPDSPPGAFTILSGGGHGTAGPGGPGGAITAAMSSGTLGGHVKVFKTGLADASFIFPTLAASNLGSIPLTVSTGSLIVAVQPTVSCSGLAAGSYFTAADTPGPVFHCQTGGTERVSGVGVSAGATLTFQAHACPAGSGLPATACVSVEVAAAFRNGGTVTVDTSAIPGKPPLLSIAAGSFYGESGSAITLKGASGGSGGSGGFFTLDTVVAQGALWNEGTVDVSGSDAGGAGATAGSGGSATLRAYYSLYNTGIVSAQGGAASGSGGRGGAGGSVSFQSSFGGIFSRGDINASGGAGQTLGADGGEVSLTVTAGVGSVRSAGAVLVQGGSADVACSTGCAGGSGGAVKMASLSGDFISSSNITTRGGDGAGGAGGAGGDVLLSALTGLGAGGGSPVATGNLQVSGNIDARGGSGARGGAGGGVVLSLDPRTTARAQEVILLGYLSLDTSGGDGTTDGGGGGEVNVVNAPSFVEGGLGAGGGAVNYADIVTSGGSGANVGGSGGAITLQSQVDNAGTIGYVEPAFNAGTLTVNGGPGGIAGGAGGTVMLLGRTAADNEGSIVGVGGTSGGEGGPGGSCSLLSIAGAVLSHGAVQMEGGAITGSGGASLGGRGGQILLRGYSVESRANLSVRGGSGGQGTGGDGGAIAMAATSAPVSNSAATLDAHGGTGATGNGASGTLVVDGQLVPIP
jgi:hypothetical protein